VKLGVEPVEDVVPKFEAGAAFARFGAAAAPLGFDGGEEVGGVAAIDFGVERVVHELVARDPAAFDDGLADDRGDVGEHVLNHAESSEREGGRVAEARAVEGEVEGADRCADGFRERGFAGYAERGEESEEGVVVGHAGAEAAVVFIVAVLLGEIVHERLARGGVGEAGHERGHGSREEADGKKELPLGGAEVFSSEAAVAEIAQVGMRWNGMPEQDFVGGRQAKHGRVLHSENLAAFDKASARRFMKKWGGKR
jgi:hypothetical protein